MTFVFTRGIFGRLNTYGLTCAVKKFAFGIPKIQYLGHIITPRHYEAKAENVRAILQASAPLCKKERRGFFGVCNWLREYVADFAVSSSLTALLSQGQPWK